MSKVVGKVAVLLTTVVWLGCGDAVAPVSDGGSDSDVGDAGLDMDSGRADASGVDSGAISDGARDATGGGDASTARPSLFSGYGHNCTVRPDSTVVCWGDNVLGQLGDGTNTDRSSPVTVAEVLGPVALSAGGELTCAVSADGTLSCWGEDFGSTPGPQPGIVDAVQVAVGGHHVCVVHLAGTVMCWGRNGEGQLGDGTTTSSGAPVAVFGLSDATQIAGGNWHTCAIRSSGQAICWGSNSSRQLGDGTSEVMQTTPQDVVGLDDAVRISTGFNHSCAIRGAGQVVCWGSNSAGQLGDDSTTTANAPVLAQGLADAIDISARGDTHSCAVRATGGVMCWGSGAAGQLGDGSGLGQRTPIELGVFSDAIAITAGRQHTCALRASGNVLCWGRNSDGQLGDGTTMNRGTPVPVTGL